MLLVFESLSKKKQEFRKLPNLLRDGQQGSPTRLPDEAALEVLNLVVFDSKLRRKCWKIIDNCHLLMAAHLPSPAICAFINN